MTTRSNLNYSVEAESIQRSLRDALSQSASASSTSPGPTPAPSTNTTTSYSIPASIALQAPLEQKFLNLTKCSKSAFQSWYLGFLNYQNQGGLKSLGSCMDLKVQRTFLRLLPQFKNKTIQQFLNTSSSDLYDYISLQFKLSRILNYRSLITGSYMKPSTKYNRDLIDAYVEDISNLIYIHPTIYLVDQGGATQKKIR